MRKIFLFAALISGITLSVTGQDVTQSISTSTVDTARFEIIQPTYDKNTTFRLDKFTGNVHRLGTCAKDDSIGSNKCWKEMIVVDLPKAGPHRLQFQIIINGPLKMILLMHIETGQTWQYGLDPLDKWYPFIECADRTDRACLWRP